MSFLDLRAFSRFTPLCVVILVVVFSPSEGQPPEELTTTSSPDTADEATEEQGKPKAMSGDYYNTFHNLHLQILQSYNPHIRPEIGSGLPLSCNFSMVVTHLADVDEDSQTVSLQGWVILSWYDHRLAWNGSTEYSEIDKLLMQQKFVWKPDVHLYNNAEAQLDELISTTSLVQLFSDGRALMDPAISLRPYCQFDYTLYPWETHKCAVYIGSWAYRTHELKWQLHPISHEALPVVYSNSHRAYPTNWRITNVVTKLADVEFDGEFWHYVNVTFHFKRSPTFAANIILLPAVVTALVCSCAFLLAAGTEWKLAIILSALLLEIVHYISIHAILPQGVINGRPLIITLCKANIFLTLIAFLLGSVAKMISHRQDEPPRWIKRVVQHKAFNFACCLCPNSDDRVPRYSLKSSQNRRQGQRDPILVTNQLITVKRSSTAQSADEQERSPATTSRNEDTAVRSWIERHLATEHGASGGNPWWRFSVALDRIIFILLAVIYAVLWAVYVGL